MSSYGVFLPEAILVATALASAVLGFAWRKRPDLLWAFSVIGTGLAIFVTLDMMGLGIGRALNLSVWPSPVGKEGDFAVELKMRVDTFALFFQLMFQFVAFLAIVASRGFIHADEPHQGEYYALMLLAVVGMMFTAAATDLFVLFLAFETSSLSTFALVAFRKKDKQATEAAVKFFIIGAVSSGIILFGISLIYGIAGTTSIGTTTTDLLVLRNGLTLAGHPEIEPPLIIALVLLIAGFGFKVAVVPFHMWAPDVYDGSPTPVTAYMASGVKAAAFAALFRVLGEAFPAVTAWHEIVWWLAVATMVVGNLIALAQRAVKRMLAYSSVAHAGYLLVAVAAGPGPGSAAFLFYLVAYTLMTLGAFALLAAKGRHGERDVLIDDFAGLATRHPWLAFALAVCMLSLLGFPGTAGFIGKWYILAAATSAGQGVLAAALVLTSVISAGYYLPVIMAMYMKPEPFAEAHVGMRLGRLGYAVVTVAVAGLLFFGVRPNRLLDLARTGGVAVQPAPGATPAAPAVTAAHAPTAR